MLVEELIFIHMYVVKLTKDMKPINCSEHFACTYIRTCKLQPHDHNHNDIHMHSKYAQILCSIGASVVVETQAVPQLFSRTVYNQFCFLQFEQETEQSINLPPEEWKDVCKAM